MGVDLTASKSSSHGFLFMEMNEISDLLIKFLSGFKCDENFREFRVAEAIGTDRARKVWQFLEAKRQDSI